MCVKIIFSNLGSLTKNRGDGFKISIWILWNFLNMIDPNSWGFRHLIDKTQEERFSSLLYFTWLPSFRYPNESDPISISSNKMSYISMMNNLPTVTIVSHIYGSKEPGQGKFLRKCLRGMLKILKKCPACLGGYSKISKTQHLNCFIYHLIW